MPRVLVVGDIATDILAIHSGPIAVGSDTAARISLGGGGSAANTAAWFAWAGVPVGLVAVIGTDAAGDQRVAELSASGVDCAQVRRSEAATTGSIIVLSDGSERSFLSDRGANLLLVPSDVDSALATAPDAVHLHLSGYALLDARSRPAGHHALAAATARGLTTSVDVASAAPIRQLGGAAFLDWVRGAGLLLANVDEARALLAEPGAAGEPGGVAAELARRLAGFAARAVVKLGASGAVWAEGDAVVTVASPRPVSVVDPTGAGDAFAAGLLAAWLTGGDPRACLEAGSTFGARAVGIAGGRPDEPIRPTGRPHR
jgi:sugar/nucleoside kinase (ribokinase family)